MTKPVTKQLTFRWPDSTLRLGALNLLSVIGFCAVSAFMLWQMRIDAERQADITSRSFVQTLAREIARNIELFDLSLSAIVDRTLRSEVMEASPLLRHMILFDHVTTAAGFTDVLILDRDGSIRANSQTLGPMSGDFTERDYFRYFSRNDDRRMLISGPLVSKLTGRQVLVFSRRLVTSDGTFAGVVAGGIELNYLRELFTTSGADRAGTVTLYGPDSAIVMRTPYDEQQIGLNVAQTASYQAMLTARSGSFTGPAMAGKGERHFVFTQVGSFPLYLSTAVLPEEIYGAWRGKALGLGAVVVCLCSVTVILTWLFASELGQRRRAEQAMSALNVELQTLAATDALTGLANRRRFDESLAREWRRAVRTRQPLSLILVDADHFKGFNDRYGHQEGDEVLKLIASSIEASVDPSHDLACRIGGEEFAVITPNTDAAGAKVVAERICQTVAGWKVPHLANPHGIVTVSCGLAQLLDIHAVNPSELIAQSDAALYEAKQAGRNRIAIAGRGVREHGLLTELS